MNNTEKHIENILEYQDYLISVYELSFPDMVDRIKSSQTIDELNSIKNDIYKSIATIIDEMK